MERISMKRQELWDLSAARRLPGNVFGRLEGHRGARGETAPSASTRRLERGSARPWAPKQEEACSSRLMTPSEFLLSTRRLSTSFPSGKRPHTLMSEVIRGAAALSGSLSLVRKIHFLSVDPPSSFSDFVPWERNCHFSLQIIPSFI